MKEEKKVFWILFALLLLTFLLLLFSSYKYYDCRCYDNQKFSDWCSHAFCTSNLGHTSSCWGWNSLGMGFSGFITLSVLSLGLLILLIYMLIKFSRTGLPRPTIDAKQKDKLSRWIALEKKSEKIDLVIFIIIMIILVCFAFKILMLGIWGFPAVLVLLAIILLFLRYKNYRWMIGFYDSLLGKLKLRK